MDTTAYNYNPYAKQPCVDGDSAGDTCVACLYPGCTNSTAPNFDPNAIFDDGTCRSDFICTDEEAINTKASYDGCTYQMVQAGQEPCRCLYSGCGNESASNFNEDSNTPCIDDVCTTFLLRQRGEDGICKGYAQASTAEYSRTPLQPCPLER
ncbi:hypothetical protein EMIHUDRAFT_231738 [Emiliania huxleyi CCMP1516]|uniref:Uncharacterized protein n=2 Tax=Emiliania huxleyi TaxID=2903 RepID=A0A0D3K729_EMIH1|nr:hypothetical protein EMIHUDRAFT_231738 [Emiliania huxleyi CCMP1516]EOD31564.1 hypothetical protein EMIHUDRAFT_231738 [Emiliania huxleyi CCMP1516]|eukprot:XP_005783993.1 hypothetical protein EMIHUDRAFT_231738 [Emiliania huxleyi CCMP1516]